MGLKKQFHNFKEKHKDKKWIPAFNAFHTFLYTPNETTHSGSHIRAVDDLKRTMNMVILAMVPCLIFGIFNAGYHHYQAFGEPVPFLSYQAFLHGAVKVIPLVVVSYGVGLLVEFLFAVVKGHEVEEGYLVTGMLVPLIVPIDTPLWMLAIAVVFGVVVGKEVFGGTGMNILNPALTVRAFLFFAYPTWMTGDKVWISGVVDRTNQIAKGAQLDAISGETILGGLAQNAPLDYSMLDAFLGFIPGSVGETSTLLIILAALFLIYTKIASWRIMLSAVLGALTMGFVFNKLVALEVITQTSNFYSLMSITFWHHLFIGGLAFGIVFMATDPVSGSQTNKGKWIYGFLIGFIGILIRVFNPAYPEGIMLSILLMNVFAPTIDHYVIQGNIKKRLKRLKVKTS
jgi:Na+-transporting NADH:ubiquinone oxidoreductase subunit B